MTKNPDPCCRLYLVTPPAFDAIVLAEDLRTALDAGDVASLQLRMKEASDDDILRAAALLLPICVSFDVALIMNDSATLAKRADADGVHLGQEDGSVADARALLGADCAIGVTCHNSTHFGFEAADAGADYVAFGAFYPSLTKIPKTTADPRILTQWSDVTEIPCVAIGGITVDNARPLVDAGAHFLAVCAGVWDYGDGPAAAVKAFNAVMGGD